VALDRPEAAYRRLWLLQPAAVENFNCEKMDFCLFFLYAGDRPAHSGLGHGQVRCP